MSETYFTIKYKGVTIKGNAYIDGCDVEIQELDIDALDLLPLCDNNTLSSIEDLIIEDHAEREEQRRIDYATGYRD